MIQQHSIAGLQPSEPTPLKVSLSIPGSTCTSQGPAVSVITGSSEFNYKPNFDDSGSMLSSSNITVPQRAASTRLLEYSIYADGDINITLNAVQTPNSTSCTLSVRGLWEISQWGNIAKSNYSTLIGYDVDIVATDTPRFLPNANCSSMLAFRNSTRYTNAQTNLALWNVSNVANMNSMINTSGSYDFPMAIANWKPTSLDTATRMFGNASNVNNDNNREVVTAILKNWAEHLPTYTSGTHVLGFGYYGVNYYADAQDALDLIISKGWTVNDLLGSIARP